MPAVNDVGEPCAGEPHARFDGRGLETERNRVTAPVPDPTNLSDRTESSKPSDVDQLKASNFAV
jgi:hypothetical protein